MRFERDFDYERDINKPSFVETYLKPRRDAQAAIDQKYADLLKTPGAALSELEDVKGGFRIRYQHGDIYWNYEAGASFVGSGSVKSKYDALGGPSSYLGFPQGDSVPVLDDGYAYVTRFEHGAICWRMPGIARALGGDIWRRWESIGAGGWGIPEDDELPTLDGLGRYVHFIDPVRRMTLKSIFWHPDTGAFEIQGAARGAYARMGYETSYLGYPISGEMPYSTPERFFQKGSLVQFQRGRIEVFDDYAKDVAHFVKWETLAETGGVRFKGKLICKSSGHYGVIASLENDAWVSVTASWSMAVAQQLPDGAILHVSKEKSLGGEVTGKDSESATYNFGGHEPRIREHWDVIAGASMKTRLSTTQHIGEMIPAFLGTIPTIIGVVMFTGLATGIFEAGQPVVGPPYIGPDGEEHREVDIPIRRPGGSELGDGSTSQP